ncbi:hypothetical protein ACFCZ1_02865 [Streptomyces sp. NPDC056224]|uniref:hypothetical protein n=1 Tax=Streptomyces sp. NPDC056224 TaxID=3345750 RepID=UPI0035D6F11D
MRESDPADLDDGCEADVLGAYLEVLRARLNGERFEALIRAVQITCALLGDGHQPVLEVPGEDDLAPDLQREYLSLMAVMITGHLDHRLVELSAPDGARGWAVVENPPAVAENPRAVVENPRSREAREAERIWIEQELEGIIRAGDSTSS